MGLRRVSDYFAQGRLRWQDRVTVQKYRSTMQKSFCSRKRAKPGVSRFKVGEAAGSMAMTDRIHRIVSSGAFAGVLSNNNLIPDPHPARTGPTDPWHWRVDAPPELSRLTALNYTGKTGKYREVRSTLFRDPQTRAPETIKCDAIPTPRLPFSRHPGLWFHLSRIPTHRAQLVLIVTNYFSCLSSSLHAFQRNSTNSTHFDSGVCTGLL